MQSAVRLSMATYTPVGYWLEQPLTDLIEWATIVVEELKAQQPKR